MKHPRRFEFDEGRQLFIGANNETLSIVAVCINNPDRKGAGRLEPSIPIPQ
jgi:hypothetical protein